MERAEPNDTKAYCVQGANGVLHVVVASERALVRCELRRPAFWQIASSSALGPARRGTICAMNKGMERRVTFCTYMYCILMRPCGAQSCIRVYFTVERNEGNNDGQGVAVACIRS